MKAVNPSQLRRKDLPDTSSSRLQHSDPLSPPSPLPGAPRLRGAPAAPAAAAHRGVPRLGTGAAAASGAFSAAASRGKRRSDVLSADGGHHWGLQGGGGAGKWGMGEFGEGFGGKEECPLDSFCLNSSCLECLFVSLFVNIAHLVKTRHSLDQSFIKSCKVSKGSHQLAQVAHQLFFFLFRQASPIKHQVESWQAEVSVLADREPSSLRATGGQLPGVPGTSQEWSAPRQWLFLKSRGPFGRLVSWWYPLQCIQVPNAYHVLRDLSRGHFPISRQPSEPQGNQLAFEKNDG